MAPNFERNLKQTCTYWAQSGIDSFGKPSFSTPVQLPCRWEDSAKLFIDKVGQEKTSKSEVFLATSISLEGYLYLGTSAAANPLLLSGAHEVQQLKSIPDLRALKTMYVAIL